MDFLHKLLYKCQYLGSIIHSLVFDIQVWIFKPSSIFDVGDPILGKQCTKSASNPPRRWK